MDRSDDRARRGITNGSREVITDRYVGERLRMRRLFLGLSAEDLVRTTSMHRADLACFEAGEKRMSATLLFQLSYVLDIPVSWFFDGIDGGIDVHPRDPMPSDAEIKDVARELQEKELLDHYFDAIRDPEKQRYIVNLARLFANEGGAA